MDLTPTPSQTIGPFFHIGCTNEGAVPRIAGAEAKGERIRLVFRVLDGDGRPVDDGMIELWQADAQGRYNHPDDITDAGPNAFVGFGRMATDAEGACVFETIKPGQVATGDGAQAPHINVSVFGRGILKRLATRVYFAGEPRNDEDPILARVPEGRRRTLMAQPDPAHSGDWVFEVHLCGDHETVFFEI